MIGTFTTYGFRFAGCESLLPYWMIQDATGGDAAKWQIPWDAQTPHPGCHLEPGLDYYTP